MAEKVTSLGVAVKNLPELSQLAESEWDRYVITNVGRPQSVLISYQEYQGMKETLELLQNPEAVTQINEGLRDLSKRKRVPWTRATPAFKTSTALTDMQEAAVETPLSAVTRATRSY